VTHHLENMDIQCGCNPFPAPDEGPCAQCQPNMILTCEEEAILARMREIKELARPITERLSEIRLYERTGSSSALAPEADVELKGLVAELKEQRARWKEWQRKLEDAIERKLIFLGHREPKEPGDSAALSKK